MTVHITQNQAVTADGATTFNLIQGEKYLIGVGGTFASASLAPTFTDGSGNAIPAGAAITAAGVTTITALTSTLVLTTSSATGSTALLVTVTRDVSGKETGGC